MRQTFKLRPLGSFGPYVHRMEHCKEQRKYQIISNGLSFSITACDKLSIGVDTINLRVLTHVTNYGINFFLKGHRE